MFAGVIISPIPPYAFTPLQPISAGTLQIGAEEATGSLGTGPVVNNSILTFDLTGSAIVPNNISGGGTLIQARPGATILTGINSYSGGTQINLGTFIGTTSSLQGAITNNTNLVFAQSGSSGDFVGTISSSGNVTINSPSGTIHFNTDQTLYRFHHHSRGGTFCIPMEHYSLKFPVTILLTK